jgi:riboflavin synthase
VFTGIVRELGSVVSAEEAGGGRALVVHAPRTAGEARVGDSVALDGCCLTAATIDGHEIAFHAVPETIARTTLGALQSGDPVNVTASRRARSRSTACPSRSPS